ncbi:30S ribosomal protein S27ae [Candidatus Woesearchaeota archaeon]|nr:30S ribosomal protein S27ae [Candidatus Woesearchaeota archaeon]
MPKKKVKNKRPSQKWKKYTIHGDQIERARMCPKCSVFLADHKDRYTCGTCGYVEIKPKNK